MKRSFILLMHRLGMAQLLATVAPSYMRHMGYSGSRYSHLAGADPTSLLRSGDVEKNVMFEEATINKNADISKDKRSIYRNRKLSKEDKAILYALRPDLDPHSDSQDEDIHQPAQSGTDVEAVGAAERGAEGSSSSTAEHGDRNPLTQHLQEEQQQSSGGTDKPGRYSEDVAAAHGGTTAAAVDSSGGRSSSPVSAISTSTSTSSSWDSGHPGVGLTAVFAMREGPEGCPSQHQAHFSEEESQTAQEQESSFIPSVPTSATITAQHSTPRIAPRGGLHSENIRCFAKSPDKTALRNVISLSGEDQAQSESSSEDEIDEEDIDLQSPI